MVVAILASLLILMLSPTIASKAMGLKGGIGKGALVGLLSLGLMEVFGRIGGMLGPLGSIVGIMGFIAAWFQLVRVVHGTDTASTIVFMFWHSFFLVLLASLVAMFFGSSAVTWWFG